MKTVEKYALNMWCTIFGIFWGNFLPHVANFLNSGDFTHIYIEDVIAPSKIFEVCLDL